MHQAPLLLVVLSWGRGSQNRHRHLWLGQCVAGCRELLFPGMRGNGRLPSPRLNPLDQSINGGLNPAPVVEDEGGCLGGSLASGIQRPALGLSLAMLPEGHFLTSLSLISLPSTHWAKPWPLANMWYGSCHSSELHKLLLPVLFLNQMPGRLPGLW